MEATTIKGTNHEPNLRRWREWRNINQEVLAEKIGVSQATLSGYEKKDKLEQEVLEKLAKALEIPVEAITEINEGAPINIFSGTWNDSSVAQNYQPTFNTLDKIVELYEKLLETEKEKVRLLEEVLKGRR
ncbi:helix-turn-helix domain-containing protein [Apibacter muscae]|uniref:helix-turn-helix domain-containing protein n=1 Tax=Apibacter muscae TaxID=2509004 RepID=UPI0011ACB625|nr:helix-turn-helix transcriptional regulator [Apibacter muscae]TWP24025.1 helix-turn-helix domain-containing protein [Apibacter muscae]